MRTGPDQSRIGVIQRNVQPDRRRRGTKQPAIGRLFSQQKGRNPVGQRGLAHALRPGDQPARMQASGVVCGQECVFGGSLPEQGHGFARMWGTLDLGRIGQRDVSHGSGWLWRC